MEMLSLLHLPSIACKPALFSLESVVFFLFRISVQGSSLSLNHFPNVFPEGFFQPTKIAKALVLLMNGRVTRL